MSINVWNHSDAVKTKVVICASLGLVAMLSLAEAGYRGAVYARVGGAWCPSVRTICPSVRVFPRVICRTGPMYYYPSYYGWAPYPVVSSTSFGNLSPAFYGEASTSRVPAPVILAPPIIDSPGSTFSWQH